jgi:polysaccharide deacetylase family protein (PEP-CTERM system associated)
LGEESWGKSPREKVLREPIKNALVVDLEHWYSPELLKNHLPAQNIDQDIESIEPILALFDKYNVKATFAILGSVAEKHPELIKEIYNRGHEIASHAYSHKMLHELGKEGFEEEIKRSVELLSSITGEKPIGFRAPSFSIDNSTKWAFEILEKYGFKYDASIFPAKTMLYGEPEAPVFIYRPSKKDVTKNDMKGEIIEFPMTVLKFGTNIPLAGGFYMRVLPFWFLKLGIKTVNKKRPAIIYIHPWEFYSKTPRLNLSLFSRFVTYYGINSNFTKLERLLKQFKFTTIQNILYLI